MKLVQSQNFIKTEAKALPLLLLVIGIIFALVYFKTDLLTGASNQQVTYYQWTDPRGEMVVSRNKPTSTDDYITFQASEDLMQNENNVDQDLIDRSNNSQTSSSQNTQKKNSTGEGTISNAYPFKAMNKAKNCTNLSGQIADARNRGKDTTELKKQHAKECR